MNWCVIWKKCGTVCSVRCLCCVNLSYEEVPQSGLLYLHPLICCSVTLTSDAKNNWCVKLNISYFLENYFVCMLHVCEREITLAVWLLVHTYYSSDVPHPLAELCPEWNPGSDCKRQCLVSRDDLDDVTVLCSYFSCQYILPCVLLPAEVLSVLIQAVRVSKYKFQK